MSAGVSCCNTPHTGLDNGLLFRRAPLGVHSTICRHQSPKWTVVVSHVNCVIHEEVIGFQVLLDSLHPRSTKAHWWLPPVLQGEAVKIFVASVSSGICAMWPNWERCRAWTIAVSCGCLVAVSLGLPGVTVWWQNWSYSGRLVIKIILFCLCWIS